MQKERQNKQNNPGKEGKEGYIIVPNYFLKKWVRVLGVGPVVLYQELLTYCHKEKYIAWPTINTLCQEMGIAKTTLLRYQNTLLRFGLIKNVTRGKSTTGHYRNNIYQVTPLKEIPNHRDIRYQNDTDIGSETIPDRFQNDTSIGSKMKLSLVSNRYPNNSNLNNINLTAAKGGKDAAAAAADFKKLKEEGEEKMQALREQLRDLDFKEEFMEKMLKEYSVEKIDEKLDLLLERKNIQNPAGWLRTALKNDYQDEERESQPLRIDSRFRLPVQARQTGGNEISRGVLPYTPAPNVIASSDLSERGNPVSSPEWTSTEEAKKAIKLIQDNLSACISPLPSEKRTRAREDVNYKSVNERRFKCLN